jgi:hypothetical protein
MSSTLQVGAILMKEWPQMTQSLNLETEPCYGKWSLLKGMDGDSLDRRIHAAGWNFFFIAAEIKVMFFGSVGGAKMQSAMKRILEKVKPQHFNSLQVTEIVARNFFGVAYVTVSAHSRHLQQGCYLDSTASRETSQHNAEWARG